MTTLLRKALAEIVKLPVEDQDAIATRFLAEVEDERAWSARFSATTDGQWDRMIAEARQDIASGQIRPLDEIFPPEETRP